MLNNIKRINDMTAKIFYEQALVSAGNGIKIFSCPALSWLTLIFALLVYGAPAIAAAGAEKPGLFVLHNVMRGPLDPSALNSSYVNGIALQIGWRDVQPEDGKYDWSQIDSYINTAKLANKRITLHLLPLKPPQWVFDAGAEPFTFTIRVPGNPRQGEQVTEYVPWDKVFLKKWTTLIEQFGARYRSDPTIFAVSVTAPAPEMMLPGSFPPHGESFQRLQAMYNRDAYLSAWRQMIDVYQQAFPDKPKFVAPGIVLEDAYFADEVLEYASNRFGDKLWVFSAGLKAVRPSRFPPMIHIYSLLEEYGKKANLGFQMIWSASRDPHNRLEGSLRGALENGIGLGAKYIEVYESDVLSPNLQGDLQYGAGMLASTAKR